MNHIFADSIFSPDESAVLIIGGLFVAALLLTPLVYMILRLFKVNKQRLFIKSAGVSVIVVGAAALLFVGTAVTQDKQTENRRKNCALQAGYNSYDEIKQRPYTSSDSDPKDVLYRECLEKS